MSQTLGPYELRQQLGAGAMGVVFEAWHPELQARYALKILRPELAEAADEIRFQRELESMAAVSHHPNVVRIHTGGVDQGRLYYVMELIDGTSLQQRLSRTGPLDPRQAASLVRDVASAVAALHSQGLIHRDIKPENIMLGEDGVPRLTDFGLARLFTNEGGRLTRTGELVGTPNFMAPEQALGLTDLGPAVDVYALGAVLYTLIAGRPPIDGATKLMVLSSAASGEVVPLLTAAPHTPESLALLCQRTLAREPEDRPTCPDLVRRLDAFLAQRTDGPSLRDAATNRTLKRVAIALAVLILTLGGAIGAVVALRGSDQGASESAPDQATRVADEVCAGLARDALPTQEQLNALTEAAKALASSTPPGAPILRRRLAGLQAECAALRSDVTGAKAALGAFDALPRAGDSKARDRSRAYRALAAGRIALSLGDREAARRPLHDLSRVGPSVDAERPDRAMLGVRLALLRGDSETALAQLPPDAPDLLRADLLAGNTRWDELQALSTSSPDPQARALASLHLGRRVLASDPVAAQQAFADAAALPDHPLRAQTIQEAHELFDTTEKRLYEQARERVHTTSGLAESQAEKAEIFRLVEVLYAAKALGYRPTKDDVDRLEAWYGAKLRHLVTIEDRYRLLQLDPKNVRSLLSFSLDSLTHHVRNPERDLPVFKRATEVQLELDRADPGRPDRSPLAFRNYARALEIKGRLDELLAFARDMRQRLADRPALLAHVNAVAARQLLAAKRIEEGRECLAFAHKTDPNELITLWTRFMDGSEQALAAQGEPSPDLLQAGHTWLRRNPDLRQDDRVAVARRVAQLETLAKNPRGASQAYTYVLEKSPATSRVAVERVQVLLPLAESDPALVREALDGLADSVRAQRELLSRQFAQEGISPEEKTLLDRLKAFQTKRLPRLIQFLETGDLEQLAESLADLRTHLP